METAVRYITVAALSHTGLIRDHNEDSLVAGPWTLCGTVTENPQMLVFPMGSPLVVAVADGIGGQPGGEVASALTVAHLAALGPSLDSEEAVREALTRCNRAVYAAAERDQALTAMGTTVAGTVVLPDALLVFNVGDSRVLEADGDGLRQVSVDDSPPLRPGQRTTSLVTQAIGGAARFNAITPHVRTVPLAEGRRYVVCTDGLTDPVLEEEIAAVLRAHDGGRAVFELWKAAIEAGAPDNITLALIGVEGEPAPD
ncbi:MULTISPECIES: PP2C family protein-serine/threonine phosphatase [Streptomyces]|uniref:PP2C family protein-serine/threonine phosphatase n=1 Tax=Streptomyces TaxID=1883 RepID=UPI0019642E3B|nr:MULTISPECIES: protein phosphatase 2C domain-containing protein [Streptomyces]QRX95990.1 serine/threonine-protein phosphatase [Streptomyces noursei]UJB45242.1 serine/threonine-protein phosphatase [Streptomyces sp. A1-5]